MNKDKYGVGIQGGSGWWAKMHISAYNSNPKTEVVALCALKTEEDALKARVKEMNLSCKIYTDFEKMISDKNVEIISICTPPYKHVSDAILAMDAGKHVLVEKPIATTLEDLELLKKTVLKTNVKTLAGFTARWNNMVRTLKALMDDKMIGNVFMVQADFWQNVGSLGIPMNKWLGKKSIAGSSLLGGGCHALDVVRWLLGEEVEEVFAYSANGKSTSYDYDPTIIAIMKLTGGAVCKIASTLEPESPYLFRIELLGTQGTIKNNLLYTKKWPGQTDYAEIPTEVPSGPDLDEPIKMEISHFIECIDKNIESHVNLKDAIKTHEALMAADIAAIERRIVKLPLI